MFRLLKKATVMVVADGKVKEAIDAAKIYIKTRFCIRGRVH